MHVRRLETLPFLALVLILGCGGSSSSPDAGGGGDKTVSGQVLDGFGQPVQNRTVLIGPGSATTDASGQFTISGVSTPYDLVILEPAPVKAGTVYSQLTRLDPKLLDFAVQGQPAMTATVGGAITGGDALSTPGTWTGIAWGSLEAAASTYPNATPYSLDVGWAGPASTTGAIHGLQFTRDENGTVSEFHSHGVKTGVALVNGQTISNADLALAAPLTDTVSTTITPPAGFEIFERDVFLTFDDGAFLPVSADGLDAGSFQLPVPSNIGARAIVYARAVNVAGDMETDAQTQGLDAGTVGAALTLPSPAQLTAPATNATGVDLSTDFVWTPVSGGIHLLIFNSTVSGDPAYAIVSGGTHARLPDLSAQGLGLPSGHSYDVVLFGLGPYASLDAFAETSVFPREGVGFSTVHFSGFTTR